ncbi:glucans biosynthesis glucosyltransferase MdoH [Halomonas sp. LS-001]
MPSSADCQDMPWLRLRRWVLVILVTLTSLAGAAALLRITLPLPVIAQLGLLILFLLTFSWIALAFWSALGGFLLCWCRRDPVTLQRLGDPDSSFSPGLAGTRTALIMPIYQEPPESTLAGLEASCHSLLAELSQHSDSDETPCIEVFILSDTQCPEAATSEARHVAALQHRLAGQLAVYYRRRPDNQGRKAGNIADFCRRWGRRYDFFVVLDADSIMGGNTLLRLINTMHCQPQVGLIQSVPIPVGQVTLFGRMVQFAAALYSPMLAAGQSFWQGDSANYWGHNAIVRTRAFMASAGLPTLPGEPPLGGELLSHDFVEAALLRRDGWHVLLDTTTTCAFRSSDTADSYESMPSNLLDFARRDRRWLQGNLQHLRLLMGSGLHPLSRCHFFCGAFAYLSSPLWLMLLISSSVMIGLSTFNESPTLHSQPLALGLLGVTLGMLLAPKLLGLTLALARTPDAYGGRWRLLASTLLEIGFAALLAPLMMAWHSLFIAGVLTGRAVEWDAQPRSERSLSWRESWQPTRWIALGSIGWMAILAWASPMAALWLTPAWLGLAGSTLLVKASSGCPGKALRLSLLQTPYQQDVAVLSAYQKRLNIALEKPDLPDRPLLPLPAERPGDMPIQSFRWHTAADRSFTSPHSEEPY